MRRTLAVALLRRKCAIAGQEEEDQRNVGSPISRFRRKPTESPRGAGRAKQMAERSVAPGQKGITLMRSHERTSDSSAETYASPDSTLRISTPIGFCAAGRCLLSRLRPSALRRRHRLHEPRQRQHRWFWRGFDANILRLGDHWGKLVKRVLGHADGNVIAINTPPQQRPTTRRGFAQAASCELGPGRQ